MPKSKLKKELTQLKKLDPKRRTALSALMIALFLVGFSAGVFFSFNREKVSQVPFIPSFPSPTPRPQTSLVLSPAYQVLEMGDDLSLSVVMSGEKVQATDITLNFDPNVFSASNITIGDAFPILLSQKVSDGEIKVSASLDPEKPVTSASISTGVVFSVDLTAKNATPSTIIGFDPQSTVTAKNGENTLGLAAGGRYIVN